MIETDRLVLRLWREEDALPFVQINQDPIVMEYFPSTVSKEDTIAMIERIKSHFKKWGFGLFATEVKSTGEFIGFIGVAHPRFESDFTPCVEIGWRLAKEHWNKGIATEGATAVLQYAFEKLELPEVYSWTAIHNKSSERVMQKIGMKHIGYFEHPNLPKGDPLTPHVIYKIDNPSGE